MTIPIDIVHRRIGPLAEHAPRRRLHHGATGSIARIAMRALLVVTALAISPGAAAQVVLPVEETPYHVPVFSNEHVIVLNVFVPPKRTSGFHRHALDSIGVLIADAERTGQVLGAAETLTTQQPKGAVSFSPYGTEPLVHSVNVIGDTPFHNVVVELRMPAAGEVAAGSRDGVAAYMQVLDNARARVWRLALEPGEKAAAITQVGPGIRIVVDGGELVERAPGRPDRGIWVRSGEFFWQEGGVTRSVENIGTTRLVLVEVEIK